MKVFFDSTVFCSDFYLSREMFRIVISLAASKGYRLYVPEVVKMEVERKHAEAIAELSTEVLRKTERRSDDLLPPGSAAELFRGVHVALGKASCRFGERFEQRLSEAGITVIPIPDVPHRDLVMRAVQRRKPFTSEPKKKRKGGYRDALIWLTILGVSSEEDEPVAFITNNIEDFYASEDGNRVHPHLASDLTAARLRSDTVTLYRNLAEFVDKIIVPDLKRADEIMTLFRENAFSRLPLRGGIQQRLTEIVSAVAWSEVATWDWDVTGGFSALEARPRGLGSVQVEDVRRLDNDRLLLRVDAAVHMWFLKECGGSYTEIGQFPVTFALSVVFDTNQKEVKSVEMMSFESEWLTLHGSSSSSAASSASRRSSSTSAASSSSAADRPDEVSDGGGTQSTDTT